MSKIDQFGISAKELEKLRDAYQKDIKAEESLAEREIDYNLQKSQEYIDSNYAIEEIDFLLSMKDEKTDIVPIKYIAADKSFYEAKLKGLKKLRF